jgi:hypothetical protein
MQLRIYEQSIWVGYRAWGQNSSAGVLSRERGSYRVWAWVVGDKLWWKGSKDSSQCNRGISGSHVRAMSR